MKNHFSELIDIPVTGNNHPAFNKFKKAANAFRYKRGGYIGLLKVQMRAVENKRDTAIDGEVKFVFQIAIALLGKVSTSFCQVLHFRIVVYIEVVRF